MKNIAVLGSTGSIGQSTLEVVRALPDEFRIVALSAKDNIRILRRQIKLFLPEVVCVTDAAAGKKLKPCLTRRIKLYIGEEGLLRMLEEPGIDMVVLAISGTKALFPLLKAIEYRKDIALANKEALVMAGELIMRKVLENKIKLIPIDSEQSAIWQCLAHQDKTKVRNIYLTASGGPFWEWDKSRLKKISVEQALRHPRWKMGRKISVDSATLMNKGLEVLEAMYLFGVASEKIKILIHPEAIIHSMVEFIDGTILAQLSTTDMRIPIQYALSYPKRLNSKLPVVDFYKLGSLNFQKPDFQRFPCLELAYQAAEKKGTAPCVLNAANEVSVEEFLRKRIDFASISQVIARVLSRHRRGFARDPNLNNIYRSDDWAREEAQRAIEELSPALLAR